MLLDLIAWGTGLFVVFGIPWLLDNKNRKNQYRINAIESMKKLFGDDYKNRFN